MLKYIVLWLFASTTLALAEETAELDDFFGHFIGLGEAHINEDGLPETRFRDLNVEIKPWEDGFEITWATTSIRDDTETDISFKEKMATQRFRATGKPTRFDGIEGNNALKGDPVSWARIDGKALIITNVLVDESGKYNVTSYRRELIDTGMALVFTRFKNGEVTRRATAELTRAD